MNDKQEWEGLKARLLEREGAKMALTTYGERVELGGDICVHWHRTVVPAQLGTASIEAFADHFNIGIRWAMIPYALVEEAIGRMAHITERTAAARHNLIAEATYNDDND